MAKVASVSLKKKVKNATMVKGSGGCYQVQEMEASRMLGGNNREDRIAKASTRPCLRRQTCHRQR